LSQSDCNLCIGDKKKLEILGCGTRVTIIFVKGIHLVNLRAFDQLAARYLDAHYFNYVRARHPNEMRSHLFA